MNKIGFQNFRRFLDFKPIEYRGISFLVGRNNAGKSTLVKALLLINKYLKSGNLGSFSFGNEVLEDANIVTFGRAKNQFAKEDKIVFVQVIDNYTIEIVVTGKADATSADVHSFRIRDNNLSFEIEIKPSAHEVKFAYFPLNENQAGSEGETNIQKIDEAIKSVMDFINSNHYGKSSKMYIELMASVKSLRKKRKIYLDNRKKEGEKADYYLIGHYRERLTFAEILEEFVAEKLRLQTEHYNKIQKGGKASEEYENLRAFKEDAVKMERSFKSIFDTLKCATLYYMGANPAKQSALFTIRDKNNALAQAVHDVYQLKITPGEKAHDFIRSWMKEFEVGDSFEIKIHAGEAYEVKIESHGAKINLADKGMGSIQAMLLILRLAAVIHKSRPSKSDKSSGTYGYSVAPIIIIEEPELNLHPALQSKLADLFYEVYVRYGIRFIVETHSEYLIRKTQLIAKDKELEIKPNENPFCVIYFDKDLKQWNMNYREDGKFIEKFGEGFYDESSNLTLNLL